MAFRSLLVLLLAAPAAAVLLRKQPVTAEGAVAASEKLQDKTTPVGMVIKLLHDLTEKVEGQGKAEAAAYDKYACFCKEQADNKQYAIEKSDKKIEELGALITELKAELKELATKISELSAEIDKLEKAIKKLDEDREAEHEVYQENAAEMMAAIDACDRAISALKDAKSAMEGKAEKEVFVQVHKTTSIVQKKGFIVLTPEQEEALNMLAHTHRQSGPTDGQAYESKFHANNITSMIQDLRGEFISEKDDLDNTEFEAKKLYDNLRLSAQNKKQFAEEDKAELEQESAAKTAQKEQAEEDKYVEERSKKADEDFMSVLTKDCADKAFVWDQRSQMRADELKALSEAIESLESGVAPNYEANRRLNDMQLRKAASFVQLRGSSDQDQRTKALSVLNLANSKLHSSALALASLRVQASEDHFVRVRQLIHDLIDRLEADAKREQGEKEYCDREVKKAVTDRDDAVSKSEGLDKDKTIKEAESKQLTMDIAELSDQIAQNKKGLMEATELRKEESTDNSKVVEDATAGLAAVKQAIDILSKFYTAAAKALIQQGKQTPPAKSLRSDGLREDELRFKSTDSDREGNTVSDLAPDVFDTTYKGQQEASNGIIGTLQVIQSDFERTISDTEAAESKAQGEFDTFKDANEKDTKTKDDDKTLKEKNLVVTNDAILSLTTDLKESDKEHKLAKEALDALRGSCTDKEETYAERVAKREQEIEALKEALNILEDWEGQ
jgi:molecular chaperone GrpE (heat shock protein)